MVMIDIDDRESDFRFSRKSCNAFLGRELSSKIPEAVFTVFFKNPRRLLLFFSFDLFEDLKLVRKTPSMINPAAANFDRLMASCMMMTEAKVAKNGCV